MEYPVNIDKMDDDYEHSDVYVVEIPSKEHDHPDVIAAKEKEIENLRKFETFEEVEDIGQTTIGSRWVVTRKEFQDGQKELVKARLVARGFQEEMKPQSDSPTAQRESLKLFMALCAIFKVETIKAVDIKAAFLQADTLDRDVFLKLPKDIN